MEGKNSVGVGRYVPPQRRQGGSGNNDSSYAGYEERSYRGGRGRGAGGKGRGYKPENSTRGKGGYKQDQRSSRDDSSGGWGNSGNRRSYDADDAREHATSCSSPSTSSSSASISASPIDIESTVKKMEMEFLAIEEKALKALEEVALQPSVKPLEIPGGKCAEVLMELRKLRERMVSTAFLSSSSPSSSSSSEFPSWLLPLSVRIYERSAEICLLMDELFEYVVCQSQLLTTLYPTVMKALQRLETNSSSSSSSNSISLSSSPAEYRTLLKVSERRHEFLGYALLFYTCYKPSVQEINRLFYSLTPLDLQKSEIRFSLQVYRSLYCYSHPVSSSSSSSSSSKTTVSGTSLSLSGCDFLSFFKAFRSSNRFQLIFLKTVLTEVRKRGTQIIFKTFLELPSTTFASWLGFDTDRSGVLDALNFMKDKLPTLFFELKYQEKDSFDVESATIGFRKQTKK